LTETEEFDYQELFLKNTGGRAASRRSIMTVTAEQVLKAMQDAGKPVRPGDVAKALDADSKEVSKAIDELKKSGKIMSPKRCYYAPAE
jgi:predicted transcriptional regulator